MTPDVSMDGDPQSGVDVYDSYNDGYVNKWYKVAGTSLSGPTLSGLIAIANQGRATANLGSLNGATQTLPKLYSISASDFHDVTSGNNGFAAGTGYDLVTGRGSPIANLFVPDLAGVSATAHMSSSTASIAGKVSVNNASSSKVASAGAGFSGVKIYLDLNNNGSPDSGEPEVTSAADGTYSFSSLSAGTYHIREVVPSNWYKITSPSSGVYTATVSSSTKVIGENWQNTKVAAGSISGYAYLDKNDDRKYDSGDSQISGVKVFLDSNKDGKLDNGEYVTTTNSSGLFSFGNLPPGVYRFVEIAPSGYHLTNPSSDYYTVTITAGLVVKNEDFGNLK